MENRKRMKSREHEGYGDTAGTDDSLANPSSVSGGSAGEESARNAGDLGSVPGSGRSPGEGNGIYITDLKKEKG